MLERTDRIALAVADVEPAIESYRVIFDAEVAGDEKDAAAGARRVTLQWGRDQVELYEPTGDGPVARFLAAGRRGLFAGGFASADPAALAARLESAGARVHEQGPERFCVYPEDLDGTGVILTRSAERERVGLAPGEIPAELSSVSRFPSVLPPNIPIVPGLEAVSPIPVSTRMVCPWERIR